MTKTTKEVPVTRDEMFGAIVAEHGRRIIILNDLRKNVGPIWLVDQLEFEVRVWKSNCNAFQIIVDDRDALNDFMKLRAKRKITS